MRTTILSAAFLCGFAWAADGPQLVNPSFEADSFSRWPGYAGANGGKITGWQGGSGVNPVWKDPKTRRGPDAPFLDNGKVPHGRQVAFIQGPGKLSQRIEGLKKGRRYRVVFWENARVGRATPTTPDPKIQVTLGGQVIVSAHEVAPVAERDNYLVPFCRVESGPFTAPEDGSYDLVFETLQGAGSTLLLDDVRIVELPAG